MKLLFSVALMPPLAALLLVFGAMPSALASAPNVLVTIKPVHSLVAGVMQGVAEPELLIDGSASPHHYAMRPSDIRKLQQAAIVFRVGASLELFLDRALHSVAGQARVLTLIDEPAIDTQPVDDHGDDDHGDDDAHDHQGGVDPHVWLNPDNAREIVRLAVRVLSEEDPDNGERYRLNGESMLKQIDQLDSELRVLLAPVVGVPYVVFHDAYGGFERYYDLSNVGVMTINPERRPGARKLAQIRRVIDEAGARCIFSEPQFSPAMVNALLEETDMKTGVLDPLGVNITAGEGAYFALLEQLADSFAGCLSD